MSTQPAVCALEHAAGAEGPGSSPGHPDRRAGCPLRFWSKWKPWNGGAALPVPVPTDSLSLSPHAPRSQSSEGTCVCSLAGGPRGHCHQARTFRTSRGQRNAIGRNVLGASAPAGFWPSVNKQSLRKSDLHAQGADTLSHRPSLIVLSPLRARNLTQGTHTCTAPREAREASRSTGLCVGVTAGAALSPQSQRGPHCVRLNAQG